MTPFLLQYHPLSPSEDNHLMGVGEEMMDHTHHLRRVGITHSRGRDGTRNHLLTIMDTVERDPGILEGMSKQIEWKKITPTKRTKKKEQGTKHHEDDHPDNHMDQG